MSRLTAGDRLARLLAIIPWVASQDGPRIEDVASRFDYEATNLVRDLQEVVQFVGVYPYSPDTLIEVIVEDGRVWISYADWFSQPLKLTGDQGLAMMAAGQSILDFAGDEDGPLLRGLTKLGAALGAAGGSPLEVRLGDASADVLAVLRQAVADSRQVEIDYYTFSRDERNQRTIEPHRFFGHGGQWYVTGYCHFAKAERVFRVDRVRRADLTDTTFEPPDVIEPTPDSVFTPTADDPRVELDLSANARWVIEQYPHDKVIDRADGGVRVRMPVTGVPWLERLLVRLGDDARVVASDLDHLDVAGAAQRILAIYKA